MERFGGSLPVKGYSGEMAGKKRVQLPADLGKGMFIVYILTSWMVLMYARCSSEIFILKAKLSLRVWVLNKIIIGSLLAGVNYLDKEAFSWIYWI